jgi:hypothetical protein
VIAAVPLVFTSVRLILEGEEESVIFLYTFLNQSDSGQGRQRGTTELWRCVICPLPSAWTGW